MPYVAGEVRELNTLGAYDELGFSLGKTFKNIGRAVGKAAHDVTAQAKRSTADVAKVASVAAPVLALTGVGLPFAGAIAAGGKLVSRVQNSNAAKLANSVQLVRRKIRGGAPAVDTIQAALPELRAAVVDPLAPNAELTRQANARTKAAQGAAIQARNRAAAAKKAADEKAAADKRAADMAAARAKKAAQGAAIQARNAAKKAAADKAAADKAAADAKRDKLARRKTQSLKDKLAAATEKAAELQRQADAAAKSGDSDAAAQLRAQSEAIASQARAVSVSSGVAEAAQLPAGGAPVAVVPAPDVAPASDTKRTLLLAGGGLAAGLALLAVSRGGGAGSRTWR